jgi:hypothetical protein
MKDMVSPEFASYHELKQLHQLFGVDTDLIVYLDRVDKQNFTSKQLCDIWTWSANLVNRNDEVASVASPFTLQTSVFKQDRLYFPNLFQDDCTDLNESWRKMKQTYLSKIFSPEIKRSLSLFFYLENNDTSIYKGFNPTLIPTIQKSLNEEILQKYPDIKVSLGGSGILEYHSFIGIVDVNKKNIVVVVLLIVLFFLFFGTLKSSLVLSITLSLTSTYLFLVHCLFDIPIDTLSNNLFLMITISTIEDFIFLSYLQKKHPDDWAISYKKIILPSFFTSLTTIIGFASLYISDLNLIGRFGLLAALGAFIEWAIVFLLLPALANQFHFFRNWVNPNKGKKIDFYLDKIHHLNLPKTLCLCALLVFPLSFFAIKNLNYDSTPEAHFPADHIYNIDRAYIYEKLKISAHLNLILSPDITKEKRQEINDKLRSIPELSFIESIEMIKSELKSKIPQDLHLFVDTGIESNAPRYYAESGHERIIIHSTETDPHKYHQIKIDIESICPNQECMVTGIMNTYAEFDQKVQATLLDSFFLCTLLVVILIVIVAFLTKKSFYNTLVIIFTCLWGPFAVSILLYLFQVPIFFITCIVFAYLIGLTGDNAIQYLLANEKDIDKNLQTFGSASIIVTIMMSVLSLVFTTAYFDPPKILGQTLFFGFILSFIGDYMILKGLLRSQKPALGQK